MKAQITKTQFINEYVQRRAFARDATTGVWFPGPGASDKQKLITILQSYGGVEEVRIYTVVVPVVKDNG